MSEIAEGEAWTEEARTRLLRDYDIVDAAREPEIDDLAALAARLCGAPIGLVSLVERERQWFAGRSGLDADQTPRDQSFCAFAMRGRDLMVVSDAREDARFADNPLVTGAPHIRFYAGAPLHSPEGAPLGSLCIIDTKPRAGLEPGQADDLRRLARQVMAQLELRRLRRLQARREIEAETVRTAAEVIGRWDWDIATDRVYADSAFASLYSVDADEAAAGIALARYAAGIHPDDRARVNDEIAATLAGDGTFRSEYRVQLPDGRVHWLRTTGRVERDGAGQPVRFPGIAIDITARKSAETALDQSESIWRTMADAIPQLAWMADREGWIFWYNQRWYDYTGTTLEEMQGWGWRAVHHPEHVERVVAHVSQCFANGTPWEDTFPIRGKDGRYRWFLSRALPIRDETGAIMRWFGTNTDVTAQFEVEAALRESEAKFRTIADAMPQMVWSTLPDGFHDYYNARWYEFTGVPTGSTDGEAWSGMFHPDDRERARARWRHSLETGDPYEIEYRLRHHSGEYRWTLGLALPIRDQDGQITRWFGTCTDIHAAKRDAEALREARTRLQLALETSQIGIWEYDAASGNLIWDERIRIMSGYEDARPGPHGGGFTPITHPEDRARIDAAIRAAIDGQARLDEEIRLLGADGRALWVLVQGERTVRQDGSIHLIGTALDIDAQKRFAEERALVAQELSHRIKNIFAVISGIIGLSVRDHPEAKGFSLQLRERLAALGRAHDFVRPHAADAGGETAQASLQDLLRELFAPYVRDESARVLIEGDDIAVDARAATPLSLLFHELATNATKYGALSRADGSVVLRGQRVRDRFEVDWKEIGGPAIVQAATHEGFGTRLSRLSVESQLRGSISRDWEADGLRVRVSIPLDAISTAD